MALIPSLHIIGSRKGGGAERFFTRLVAALNRAGHPATAVCRPGSWVAENLAEEIPRILLPMPGAWDPVARWRLGRLIRRSGAAVVQTYMGRATRLVRLPAGRKPVHVARLGGFYDLEQYKHAHAWVGNTRGIFEHLVSGGIAPVNVFEIGNFAEPKARDTNAANALRVSLGLPDEACVALCVARLHPNKGIDVLLEAWANIPPRLAGRPAYLLIAGDGPLRKQLQSKATELGLDKRLRWCGWQDDLTACYSLCDVLACPSVHEPLGNVVLEAWAHHCPVIASRTQGPLELIDDGVNGRLVPVGDSHALGSALKDLLESDGAQRERLAAAGYDTLLRRFTPTAIVEQYLDMYRVLLERVRP